MGNTLSEESTRRDVWHTGQVPSCENYQLYLKFSTWAKSQKSVLPVQLPGEESAQVDIKMWEVGTESYATLQGLWKKCGINTGKAEGGGR